MQKLVMSDVAEQKNIGECIIGNRQIHLPETIEQDCAMPKIYCLPFFHKIRVTDPFPVLVTKQIYARFLAASAGESCTPAWRLPEGSKIAPNGFFL